MRTEHEIMNLVLDVARADERIRAVLLVDCGRILPYQSPP